MRGNEGGKTMVEKKEKKKEGKEISLDEALTIVTKKDLIGKLSDEEKAELNEVLFAEEQSSKSSFILGGWVD
jgi:hypothetical protein